jgi:hypothetical protein
MVVSVQWQSDDEQSGRVFFVLLNPEQPRECFNWKITGLKRGLN